MRFSGRAVVVSHKHTENKNNVTYQYCENRVFIDNYVYLLFLAVAIESFCVNIYLADFDAVRARERDFFQVLVYFLNSKSVCVFACENRLQVVVASRAEPLEQLMTLALVRSRRRLHCQQAA